MDRELSVESLLAVIGADNVLKGEPSLNKTQIRRAAELPKEIRRRVLRWLATSAVDEMPDFPRPDYDEILKLLTAPPDQSTTDRVFAIVPDREMATDLALAANRVKTWANGILPRDTSSSFTGPRLQRPDPHQLADFTRQWVVAINPMIVIDDLLACSLDPDQVAAVALLYPSLYAEMRSAITEAKGTLMARNGGDWEPTQVKAQQVATLLQEDGVDVELAGMIQQLTAKEGGADGQQQAPRRRASKSKIDLQQPTPGERAAAGQ